MASVHEKAAKTEARRIAWRRDPRITRRGLRPLQAPSGKAKGLESPGKIPRDSSPLHQRAIQDSNLWPLAPEANALSS